MADEMEEIVAEFVVEAEESLEKIDPLFVELEEKGHDKEILNEIFRSMHTLKGAAGFLGFQQIVDVAHRAENILKKLRDGEMAVTTPLMDTILKSADVLRLLLRHIKAKDGASEDTAPILAELDAARAAGSAQSETRADVPTAKEPAQAKEAAPSAVVIPEVMAPQRTPEQAAAALLQKEAVQTLRIDVSRVDKVMDLTGEIVLVRNRLLNIASYLENRYGDDATVEGLIGTVSFLDLVASDMQLAVMKMRMQPLKKVFGKFPRLVRDLSNGIGKEVELQISGEETEVDRSVIEHIGDPMVHIIRNSIDHGLELPADRLRKGKASKGRIAIHAFQQGNQIIIEVTDDGKGIDIERVKQKAVQRGLISEEESLRMPDENAVNLIFLPGFSTAEVATELSGRGVGMDVVKTSIAKLNGYVEVTTKKDEGTTFRISIPLTLAIIQALMVSAGGEQFAIPLAPIEETLKVPSAEIENVTGQKVLVVRERVCPLFELTEILSRGRPSDPDYRYVIVIAIGDRRFCIAVDELHGQEEVVIKNIDGIDTEAAYVVGATITGEGKVVLILDLAGIFRNVVGAVRS